MVLTVVTGSRAPAGRPVQAEHRGRTARLEYLGRRGSLVLMDPRGGRARSDRAARRARKVLWDRPALPVRRATRARLLRRARAGTGEKS